jgi:hypothetical protein
MKRARMTAFWRQLIPRHRELWLGLLDDPEKQPELYRLEREAEDQCAAFHLLQDARRSDEANIHAGNCGATAARITLAIVNLSPELTHFYGDQLGLAVGHFIEGQVLQGLYGLEEATRAIAEAPPLFMRGVPGTPIKLDDPLSLAEATTRDLFALGRVMKAYRPEGRRGRPSKVSKKTKVEAEQALAMDQAGATWLDIAEGLWNRRPDQRRDVDYEAIRKKVRARVNLGKKLAATN